MTIDSGASLTATSSNAVIANLIGVDASAAFTIPNFIGVHILGKAQNNMVGGEAPSAGNLISGNNQVGILIEGGDARNNTVLLNMIGTDWSGSLRLGNAYEGIKITDGAQQNFIGPANRVAFNGYPDGYCGIDVRGVNTYDNRITRNSIYANSLDGICNTFDAQHDLERPVILSALTSSVPISGSIVVTGTACLNCDVELFANPDNDGEGKLFLGLTDTDPSGNFVFTLPFLPYRFLTATAIDDTGSTSRFSLVFETNFNTVLMPLILKP